MKKLTVYHIDKIVSAEDNKYKIISFDITEKHFLAVYENLQTKTTKNKIINAPIVDTLNDGFVSSVIYDKIHTLFNKIESIESSKEVFLGKTFATKADLDAFCKTENPNPFPEENKIITSIIVEDIEDFDYGTNKTINITLKDNNNEGLSNRSLNVFIEEINYFTKVFTNQNGIANLILKDIPSGDYNISFNFVGNNTYKSSTLSKTFTVNKIDIDCEINVLSTSLSVNKVIDIQTEININDLINKELMEVGVEEINYKSIVLIQNTNTFQIDNFIAGNNTFYVKIPETRNTNETIIKKTINIQDIPTPVINTEKLDAGTQLLYKFKYNIVVDIENITGTVEIYCNNILLKTTTVLSDTYTYTPDTTGDKVIKIIFTPDNDELCHSAEREIPFVIKKLTTEFVNVSLTHREQTNDYLLKGQLIDEDGNPCVSKEIKLYIDFALINLTVNTDKNGEFEYTIQQNINENTVIQISFIKRDEFYLSCDYIC